MDLKIFKASLTGGRPPERLSPVLEALWYEANGDWDRAHRIVQDIPGADAAWVHAYLHRREGDTWNAGYWYSRAGRQKTAIPLDSEWERIAAELLAAEIP